MGQLHCGWTGMACLSHTQVNIFYAVDQSLVKIADCMTLRVHDLDSSVPNQLIYSRNGINITSTPVRHYETDGPVALRLDWNGLSVTYSGQCAHYSKS